MSWLDDLRARKDKHAGIYTVDLNGSTVEIPLKYPTAEAKAKIVEKIQAGEKEKNISKIMMIVDEVDRMMLRACIAEGEPNDEEISMIVCESGGRAGLLIPRCSKLLGLDMILNISGTDGGR